MSSLNPYAASYVPLSKREEDNKAFEITAGDPNSGDRNAWSKPTFKSQQDTKQNQLHDEASLNFNIHGIREPLNSRDIRQKNHLIYDSPDLWTQSQIDVKENKNADEDFEMDLAYLSVMFPGISDQSLADVYSVNGGDLEASADMLHQLEVYPEDASQHLPESLDIGDMSEYKCSAEGPSVRLEKTTSGEASGSSSS